MAAWVLTIVILAAWFVAFRPQALGGPAGYVGVSGHSMLPTMHQGDMAVVEKKASYRVGDVIVYRVPAGDPGAGNKIVHRIVGGDAQHGFVTKGDNNSYTDIWHPTQAQVVGKVWLRLPSAAGALGHLRRPGWLAAIVGLTTFLVLAVPAREKPVVSAPALGPSH